MVPALASWHHDNYEHLKGRRLRMTRLRVPGKEVCLAHIITPTDPAIYQNLALHIGVHAGEDHTGEAIGMIRLTPWETVDRHTAARRLCFFCAKGFLSFQSLRRFFPFFSDMPVFSKF